MTGGPIVGMSRKRGQLTAYFAGLFDGEGSIGIYHRTINRTNPVWKLRVGIAMCDPLALALLKREYPEALFWLKQSKNPNHNDVYIFELNDFQAEQFLKDIKPFVLIKWQQVKVGLSFLAHKRKATFSYRNLRNEKGQLLPFPEDFHKRCEKLAETMKALKTIRVNSVNTHEMREYRAKPEDVVADEQYIKQLLESVETKDSESIEPISALEPDIVH